MCSEDDNAEKVVGRGLNCRYPSFQFVVNARKVYVLSRLRARAVCCSSQGSFSHSLNCFVVGRRSKSMVAPDSAVAEYNVFREVRRKHVR